MTNTPKGCCPKCGKRITFIQAVVYGPKQSFLCSDCRTPIKRKEKVPISVSIAGIGVMVSYFKHDSIAVTAALLLLLVVSFGVSAMFTARIEESAEVFD